MRQKLSPGIVHTFVVGIAPVIVFVVHADVPLFQLAWR
jgi:hypothetical protein